MLTVSNRLIFSIDLKVFMTIFNTEQSKAVKTSLLLKRNLDVGLLD